MEEELAFSDELLDLCEWIVNEDAERTWDLGSDELRRAGAQLVAMVAPVLDDRPEVKRRVQTWAQKWSFT